jgi:hypothetical protein
MGRYKAWRLSSPPTGSTLGSLVLYPSESRGQGAAWAKVAALNRLSGFRATIDRGLRPPLGNHHRLGSLRWVRHPLAGSLFRDAHSLLSLPVRCTSHELDRFLRSLVFLW